MTCLTSHFFPGQVLHSFARYVLHFGWTRAMSHLAGQREHRMRKWHHRVLTYTLLLKFTFHFNNIWYPQLRCINPLPHRLCACTCANFSHVDSPLLCALCLPSWPEGFQSKMCQVSALKGVTALPSSECCSWNSLPGPSCQRFASECVWLNVRIANIRSSARLLGTVTKHCSNSRHVSSSAIN